MNFLIDSYILKTFEHKRMIEWVARRHYYKYESLVKENICCDMTISQEAF